MTSDEIRAGFLSFFEEKGHKVIHSSSLIPQGDPTLLLTTAGMVQFKPYFLGEAAPPSHRLASCQKCFRTTDIESVGDAGHLTFFEMLGNFSIGDYFKQEAISWAWEFITQRLKLPPERLWITIYLDDDEAFRYWKETGVPGEKILRCGEEDNFWGPAGNSGPCGPCSEIHYDFGEEAGCGKSSCAPNCECGRFSEIWNLVFTQFNQDETGQRIPLPKPNIDTGMGLERTAAAVLDATSVYQTDLFMPLLEGISGLTGKKYGHDDNTDNAMRIVVEHGRAVTFLIADGVMPGNEGRGYVLRRLLRRAALFGRRLGLTKLFLNQIAGTTVGTMAKVYPELQQRQNFIYQVIGLEERKFEETLSTGLELIDNVLTKKTTRRTREISGRDAFKLYDTYGFPVELTREIVAKSGFSVDMEGFEAEMKKQRERSRATHKFESKETVKLDGDIPETSFVGYSKLDHKSTIVEILVDNSPAKTIGEGQAAGIILDTTPFYGEMGGQAGDTGEISSSAGRFSVTDTVRIPPDIIVHQGKVTAGSLRVGDEVNAEVDKERRLDIARNHTATHLLHSALRQILGEYVQQRGSLVAPDRLRFDFSHLIAMTGEEINKVQHIVNDKIRQNLAVESEETSYKRAIEEGAIALFNEKYGEAVRVMKIGEPAVSTELCGGTHVTTTGEIGYFHIITESSIGTGLRRIEAVTGRSAEEFISQRLSSLENIAQSLESPTETVPDKVNILLAELDRERKRTLSLESEMSRITANDLLGQSETVKGIKIIAAEVPSSRMEILRQMSDHLRDAIKSGIIVLGSVYDDKPIFLAAVTPDLVARGYHAGEIVKQVAKVTGGSGGGKPNLAQAGGKHKDKLGEALRLVKSLI